MTTYICFKISYYSFIPLENDMSLQKSDWKHEDNKHYKGHLDRIYVSREEEWEVGYFVDKYIKDNGAKVTDANRDIVMAGIAKYTGKAPIKREDLTKHLDDNVTLK